MLIFASAHCGQSARSPARRSEPDDAKIRDTANQIENLQPCVLRRATNASTTQSLSKNGSGLKRPAAKMLFNTMGAARRKP